MILVKLIKVAFLLKELDLKQFFNDQGCDITALVNYIETTNPEILHKLCEILTGDKPTCEVDAMAGVVNFILSLKKDAQASPNLVTMIMLLPIGEDMKKSMLKLLVPSV